MSRRHCLITGASSGIGAAFASTFAQNGWDLTITGRDEARLERVAGELRQRHSIDVHAIVSDLADPKACRRLVSEIRQPVDGLVNNAGYAPKEEFSETSWVEHLAFLQTMLAAPTELVHLLGPGMKERGFGRIINVSSVMAYMPSNQEGGLYGPTKSYLLRFSEAMHATFYGTGVHVTALCPGLTRTDIFDRAGIDAMVKDIPDPFWQTPEEVAAFGYAACEKNNAVAVSGMANKAQVALMRLIPGRVARLVARQIRPRDVH